MSDSRAVQPANAPFATVAVLPSAKITEVSAVHPRKAFSPISVMHAGISSEVRPVQFSNAPAAIFVTLPSVGITELLKPIISVPVALSMRQLPIETYFSLSRATVTAESAVQPSNTPSPILTTPAEISMPVKEAHPANAPSPMV